MKKLLILILALILCVSVFAACDKNDEKSTEAPSEEATVPAGSPVTDDEGLQAAYDYIHQLYKDIAEKTGANYNLITKLEIEGVAYTITWTVSDEQVKVLPVEGKDEVTISVPQDALADIPYTLTATIANAAGKTVEKSYEHIVPKFAYTSFAEYAAAEKGDPIVVSGVITGIVSKATGSNIDGLYLQDAENKGGYYIYGVKSGFEDLQVGMTVEARGTMDIYNGTYEVKDAAVKVLSSEITPVTPVDFTSIIANAKSLSDKELAGPQGMLVTIKGVTIGEAGDNGYYHFTAGQFDNAYLRISSSANPCTAADKDAIIAAHAANYGNTADVTGVISIYNGNFYLSPVSAEAFNNFSMPERNDQEKAEFELSGIKFEEKITSDGEVALTVAGVVYDSVKFTWASNSDNAVVDGGKVTFTVPDEEVVVKLTVTATCGTATATKEFEVKLSKKITSIEEANEIGNEFEKGNYTEDKYLIAGVITEVQNETYGNVIISDGTNSILVYGLYNADGTVKYDALETKPVVGDYITVLGVIGKYNDPQVKNGWIISHVPAKTIEEANTIAGAQEDGKYTEEKYVVSGVITEIANDKYGNLYLATSTEEGAASIYVYGLYDVAGNKYEDMTTKPVVGDTISVISVIGNYVKDENKTLQLKNATVVSIAATTEGGEGEGEGGETPTPPAAGTTLTIPAAVELGSSMEHDNYTAEKYTITGTVTAIKNATYGNVNIADADGNEIYIYGLWNIDGTVRYDAMETKPAVGDVITVTSIVGQYNGTAQLKNAWVVECSAHTCTYEEFPAKCDTCGAVKADHTECVDADGNKECDGCGAVIAAPVEGTLAATLDFSVYADRVSYSKEEEVWANNGLTMTHTKGGNDLYDIVTKEYTSIRLYGNAKLTLEYTGIAKIVIHADETHSDTFSRLSSLQVEGAVVEAAEKSVTITLATGANSVVITNGHTSQIRIASIDIYTA